MEIKRVPLVASESPSIVMKKTSSCLSIPIGAKILTLRTESKSKDRIRPNMKVKFLSRAVREESITSAQLDRRSFFATRNRVFAKERY